MGDAGPFIEGELGDAMRSGLKLEARSSRGLPVLFDAPEYKELRLARVRRVFALFAMLVPDQHGMIFH